MTDRPRTLYEYLADARKGAAVAPAVVPPRPQVSPAAPIATPVADAPRVPTAAEGQQLGGLL